jgi:hypothetical protein
MIDLNQSTKIYKKFCGLLFCFMLWYEMYKSLSCICYPYQAEEIDDLKLELDAIDFTVMCMSKNSRG